MNETVCRYLPKKTIHTALLAANRSGESNSPTSDRDGVIDTTRVSVQNLFGQKGPSIDQVSVFLGKAIGRRNGEVLTSEKERRRDTSGVCG